jgi:hypothetical protein
MLIATAFGVCLQIRVLGLPLSETLMAQWLITAKCCFHEREQESHSAILAPSQKRNELLTEPTTA